jgi:hypothetical protein
LPSYSIDWHASHISFTTGHIHRLDFIDFPTFQSPDKAPFFQKSKGMPYFNPLFVFLWFHGFTKTVNMYPYLVPASDQSMAVLFACKIPKADCTASKDNFINENLILMFHFLVAGSLNAGATARRNRKLYFGQQIACAEQNSDGTSKAHLCVYHPPAGLP